MQRINKYVYRFNFLEFYKYFNELIRWWPIWNMKLGQSFFFGYLVCILCACVFFSLFMRVNVTRTIHGKKKVTSSLFHAYILEQYLMCNLMMIKKNFKMFYTIKYYLLYQSRNRIKSLKFTFL